MNRTPFTRLEFLRFLMSGPLYVTFALLVCEALLSAATTWLVIKAGRDVANGDFLVLDLLWILAVQSLSYLIGAVSWVFAERAGMRAFGLYMARFARDNRHYPTLLGDRHAREQIEPFLTGETFAADSARDMGLVTHVADDVAAVVDALVTGVLAGAPQAVKATKRVLRQGQPTMAEMLTLVLFFNIPMPLSLLLLTITAAVGTGNRSPIFKSAGGFPTTFEAPWNIPIGLPSADIFSSM